MLLPQHPSRPSREADGSLQEDLPAEEEVVPVVQTVGLAGGGAVLPCNTSAPAPANPAILVIWYKNEGDPVFR